MMKRMLALCGSALLCCTLLCAGALAATSDISIAPQYLFAGAAQQYYAEEAYHASPVVVDLDGDGRLEVITASYALTVMDAATGAEKWRVNAGRDRYTPYTFDGNIGRQVFCDFTVTDIDSDGSLEIIVGYGNGSVSVLDATGHFKPGWPQAPSGHSVRCVRVADLNGDGTSEIIVGVGVASPTSVWVYGYNGTLLPGWPQLYGTQNAGLNTALGGTAFGYGVWSDSIAVGNMDGDAALEFIVPTDTAYMTAYNMDGTLVPASPLYGENRTWGKIALYEDMTQENALINEGWGYAIQGDETRQALYRAELGHSAAQFSDVDGDGVDEVAVTALIIDRTGHSNTGHVSLSDSKYMTVFLLNQDRTRYTNPLLGFDWTASPKDLGGPLKKADSISMAAGVLSKPVCADLDGDNRQEILFNTYNGKLHCFSLDGKEHGAWPFVLPATTATVYEYAAPPACVDLDGDGKKEVIFASWTDGEEGTNVTVDGSLYILSSDGVLLARQPLHTGYASYEGKISHANGVMGTPVVMDGDGDGKWEIFLNTTYYALCVYEVTARPATPPTAYARNQTISIDGKNITFQTYALKSYEGNETNYIKVRDIALALDTSGAQFNVDWDGVVTLQPGVSYRPNATEMTTPFSGDRPYTRPKAITRIDGKPANLDAITLNDQSGNGYTYYKLRDLAAYLNFNVTWSANTGITVTT